MKVWLLPILAAFHVAAVERWSVFEVSLIGPSTGNPFTDVKLSAEFELTNAYPNPPTRVTVDGFYDGESAEGGIYKIRFAPPDEGEWYYGIQSNVFSLLNCLTCNIDASRGSGKMFASGHSGSNHGPVISKGFKLEYADGTPYFSVGSTSYQWSSMPLAMQAQTLQTLKNGQGDGQVFNKQRMTVFPMWYRNNRQNPPLGRTDPVEAEVGTPYEILPGSVAADYNVWNCVGEVCPSTNGSFDFTRFNVAYWRNFEHNIAEMQKMGVIADIIAFHPYDNGHWGFDCMGGHTTYNTTHDNFYLKYLAARLSSYSNVWWSMANEWDSVQCKSFGSTVNNGPTPVWDELFGTLSAADPYGRQMSIHNGQLLYNHSQPWITHVSLQGNIHDTPVLRAKYGKPVIWDEEGYEGNITSSWGALSGEEMTDRFWLGASLGVHVGHSETILRPNIDDDNQPLWWSKGGELVGTSPARIKWFRQLWEGTTTRPSFGDLVPTQSYFDDANDGPFVANLLSAEDGSFISLHFLRAGRWTVPLNYTGVGGTAKWEVRYLDYYGMKVTVIDTLSSRASRVILNVTLPGGNYEIACSSCHQPHGSYEHSCSGCTWANDTLTCSCTTAAPPIVHTSTFPHYSACLAQGYDLGNKDGSLVCNKK